MSEPRKFKFTIDPLPKHAYFLLRDQCGQRDTKQRTGVVAGILLLAGEAETPEAAWTLAKQMCG